MTRIRAKQLAGDVAVLAVKDPVKVATTANITLSGEQTIDGVLTSADRVLVKNQTTASQNGIYVSAAGAWTRAEDFDTDPDVGGGVLVSVSEGTANGNTTWRLTTDDPIVVGTTALAFANIASGGGGGDNIQVNAVAATDANFNDTTPAAPAGAANVDWASTGASPTSVSASVAGASETAAGVVERATQAEVDAGADTTRYVSPATLEAKLPRTIAKATGDITRTADTYALATGMTITPGAGTYIARFSGTVTNNGGGNAGTDMAVFFNGLIDQASERSMRDKSADQEYPFSCEGSGTIAAGQTIEGRWADSGGATSTMRERTLVVERIGD